MAFATAAWWPTWLITINFIFFSFSTKDQIQNGKQHFSRSSYFYLNDGDFMLLEPGNCWMLHIPQLPNGGNLIWRRARLSILLGLVATHAVMRMSFNRLPRHLFAEGMERRRGKKRVSADKQTLRLRSSLGLILNTRKIVFVMSKIFLNENSQSRTSLSVFIKLCFKSCGTHLPPTT